MAGAGILLVALVAAAPMFAIPKIMTIILLDSI